MWYGGGPSVDHLLIYLFLGVITYTQPQSSPLTKMKTRLSEPTVIQFLILESNRYTDLAISLLLKALFVLKCLLLMPPVWLYWSLLIFWYLFWLYISRILFPVIKTWFKEKPTMRTTLFPLTTTPLWISRLHSSHLQFLCSLPIWPLFPILIFYKYYAFYSLVTLNFSLWILCICIALHNIAPWIFAQLRRN